MPWLHIEWGENGVPDVMEITNDDAEPIATLVSVSVSQPRLGPTSMQMEFVIEDFGKFQQAVRPTMLGGFAKHLTNSPRDDILPQATDEREP